LGFGNEGPGSRVWVWGVRYRAGGGGSWEASSLFRKGGWFRRWCPAGGVEGGQGDAGGGGGVRGMIVLPEASGVPEAVGLRVWGLGLRV
jgi:hypothetical protein